VRPDPARALLDLATLRLYSRHARGDVRAGPAAESYSGSTMTDRLCSKVACNQEATSTLTYDYADSMAVLGPLGGTYEPHSYDLCERHAERLSAPQGWQVVRHAVFAEQSLEAQRLGA
jgi:hypothetical protein